MKKYLNVHTIWLTLVLLTLSTYLFGYFHSTGTSVVMVLIFIATIKSILIIRNFMGLRGVSLMWRLIMYGWLLIVCSGILIAYAVSA